MPVVRRATETDIEAIAKMEMKIFSDAWTLNNVYETFCQPQAFIVVAEQKEEIVGYCIVYYVLDEGEIARIAVDSKCRRQGVGRQILEHVKEICKEKEITRLLLDVRESNSAARAFYKHYGFCEDGIRKNFYEMPREHAVLMSCSIG